MHDGASKSHLWIYKRVPWLIKTFLPLQEYTNQQRQWPTDQASPPLSLLVPPMFDDSTILGWITLFLPLWNKETNPSPLPDVTALTELQWRSRPCYYWQRGAGCPVCMPLYPWRMDARYALCLYCISLGVAACLTFTRASAVGGMPQRCCNHSNNNASWYYQINPTNKQGSSSWTAKFHSWACIFVPRLAVCTSHDTNRSKSFLLICAVNERTSRTSVEHELYLFMGSGRKPREQLRTCSRCGFQLTHFLLHTKESLSIKWIWLWFLFWFGCLLHISKHAYPSYLLSQWFIGTAEVCIFLHNVLIEVTTVALPAVHTFFYSLVAHAECLFNSLHTLSHSL